MENGKIYRFIVPKIINVLALLLVGGWMIWGVVDSLNQINAGNGWAGIGYAVVLVIGGIACAACLLFSFICFIIAIVFKNKGKTSAKNIITFVIFSVIPIILFITVILLAPNS